MKKKPAIQGARRGTIASLALSCFMPAVAYAQTTGWNKVDDTTTNDYNDTSNWVGGTINDINGIWDSTLTLTAAQTAKFGADTGLTTGLNFNYAGNFDLTLRSDGSAAKTITLGGNVNVNPASNRTINIGSLTANQGLNVNLGGNRTFTVTTSKALNFFNTISGGDLTVSGASATTAGGTVRFSRANGNAAGSNITVANNATLQIDNSTNGNAGATRANGLTLTSGGKLSVRGNNTNTVETFTGNLTTDGGGSRPKSSVNAYHSVTLDAGSAHTLLSVPGLTRTNKGTLLVRGDNLGLNSIASTTAGSSNIQLTGGVPTMIGGSGAAGTTNVSIIPWLVGGTGLADSGSSLATHDAANGLRPLDFSTEFAAGIGVNSTDNVRLTATADTAISGNQTVNSLILSAAGGSISGSAPEDTLTVTSGAILLTRTTGANSNINVNVNFGAAEGLIGFIRGETVNGAIAGSGGLTIHGNRNDELIQLLNGTSTYTGNTTILSNAMVATGFLPHGGRTGDVYVYGNLQLNTAGYSGTINGLFGTGIVAYGNSGVSSLTIGDNNATATFNGTIVANSNLKIIKTGSGTQTLAGTHTWGRGTELRGGILSVDSIANGGVDSGIGNSTTGATNLLFNGGTLRYTGAGTTTDRLFRIGETGDQESGTIDASGSGPLEFTATSPVTYGTAGTNTFPHRRTIIFAGTNTGDNTLAGDITNNGLATNGNSDVSVIKQGTGKWILAGANSYGGNTEIQGGTLVLSQANPSNENSSVSIASSATLSLGFSGTDTVDKLFVNGVQQPAGIYKASGNLDPGTPLAQLAGTGTLTVTSGPIPGSGYAVWATTNAGGQTANLDYDNDGVSNGIEYFLNAPAGLTTLPGIAGGAITWTNGGNIAASAYGAQYVVQTSPDLVSWSNVPVGSLTTNTDGPAGSLTYTLPTGAGKIFVRLAVDPQ